MKTIYILRKNILTAMLLTLLVYPSFGQMKLQQAHDLKAQYNYAKAIDAYQDYFKNTSPSIDNARDMAECFLMINDTKSAEKWMSVVLAYSNYSSSDVLAYAKILKSNGKYDDAIMHYQIYAQMQPDKKEMSESMVNACKDAMEWIKNPEYIEVSNVSNLNSDNADFGMISFADGYIITSDRKMEGKIYGKDDIYGWTDAPYLQMYFAPKESSGNPSANLQPMEALNTKYHNGPGVFDQTMKTLYFTRTKMVKVKNTTVNIDPTNWDDFSVPSDYTNRLEIFSATYKNGQWGEAKPFEYNNVENYSVGHPAISPDGETMYFASDMPGGYGESDIYYCTLLDNGKWSKPVNAGSAINSAGKEVFPFVDKDGSLYFSSDGLPGMGGLDIFKATGSTNNWSAPVNLKYPINSPKDDFSINFTETGKAGYLSSDREGGNGKDDVYSFIPSPPTILVMIGKTKEVLPDKSLVKLDNVNVSVTNTNTNEVINLVSDGNGKFESIINCNASYDIKGTKESFFSQSKSFETACKTKSDTVFVELDLTRFVINKPIVLENIYYDFDKWNIRPDAAIELDKLVKILQENPKINIELSSHTDSRGSYVYNDTLSQRRAESAVKYIISKGIESSRITAKGYGEHKPVNTCTDNNKKCTEEQYQMNRRTEFKVTSIKN